MSFGEGIVRPNSIIILVVAILLGGTAAFLARNWLVSRTQVTAVNGTIIVAAQRLPFGTPLTDNNVKVIPWAAKTVPPGAFSSKPALFKGGSRVTLATIELDEPILKTKITGPGQRASLSTLLSNDARAITIRVDDVRGVAGFILPNDRVDVVLIRKGVSDLLLQDIKVIAIDQISDEQKNKAKVAKAVTLEVTPYQAQKISLAQNIGSLSLILRKAGDSDVVANRRVTDVDLLEGNVVARKKPEKPTTPAAKPAPVVPAPRPAFDATVSIVRNLKSQDYKVIKEGIE